MGIGSFFKTAKHRSFQYRPIYFNPEQEELRERIAKAQREAGIEPEQDNTGNSKAFVSSIKGKMHKNLMTQQYSKAGYDKIRSVIIIAAIFLLIALFYLVLKVSGLFFVNG